MNKDLKNHESLKILRNLKFSNAQILNDLKSLIEKGDSKIRSCLLIDIYTERRNKNYGDRTTNKFNEENDDDWVKEIEMVEKKVLKEKKT